MRVLIVGKDELLLTPLTGVRVTILAGHLLTGDRRVGGHTNRATICHFYVDTAGRGAERVQFFNYVSRVFTEMADG